MLRKMVPQFSFATKSFLESSLAKVAAEAKKASASRDPKSQPAEIEGHSDAMEYKKSQSGFLKSQYVSSYGGTLRDKWTSTF